ncbi:MAG: hypothetical protein H6843_09275 [Rhodospirillaceae bacterium]|nr:hypothetical protein [Rhodospirillaceae bacterium]
MRALILPLLAALAGALPASPGSAQPSDAMQCFRLGAPGTLEGWDFILPAVLDALLIRSCRFSVNDGEYLFEELRSGSTVEIAGSLFAVDKCTRFDQVICLHLQPPR